MQPIFHLSIFVRDLEEADRFYGDLLGCKRGRSTDTWVDYDFFGHEISLHLGEPTAPSPGGRVDGVDVLMPHFGVITDNSAWEELAERLRAAEVNFILAPTRRFEGKPGDQRTMFFTDPSGNAIELKTFARSDEVFAR